MPDPAAKLLIDLLYVAAGSALGGPARFLVSGVVARHLGETFPWGTMVVNVSGALAIGAAAALLGLPDGTAGGPGAAWLLGVTGFLGCYTTVSSFSLQTLALLRDGEPGRALLNIALSVALCLSAAAAGLFAVRTLVAGDAG